MSELGRPRILYICMMQLGVDGLVAAFQRAGFEAGAAHDVASALAAIERERPQLVIISLLQPEPRYRAFQLCREIVKRWPETRVIVLRRDADEDLVQTDAALAGASACLMITVSNEELIAASRQVLRQAIPLPGAPAIATVTYDRLTLRQSEVLRLAAEGRHAPEIAAELGISVNTVKVHQRAIREKLRVSSIVAAVERARRLGMV